MLKTEDLKNGYYAVTLSNGSRIKVKDPNITEEDYDASTGIVRLRSADGGYYFNRRLAFDDGSAINVSGGQYIPQGTGLTPQLKESYRIKVPNKTASAPSPSPTASPSTPSDAIDLTRIKTQQDKDAKVHELTAKKTELQKALSSDNANEAKSTKEQLAKVEADLTAVQAHNPVAAASPATTNASMTGGGSPAPTPSPAPVASEGVEAVCSVTTDPEVKEACDTVKTYQKAQAKISQAEDKTYQDKIAEAEKIKAEATQKQVDADKAKEEARQQADAAAQEQAQAKAALDKKHFKWPWQK
jgi:hypothetical protein